MNKHNKMQSVEHASVVRAEPATTEVPARDAAAHAKVEEAKEVAMTPRAEALQSQRHFLRNLEEQAAAE